VSVRCFVGVELPESYAGPLTRAGAAIRELDRSWIGEKWVTPDNLHLTLAFIGSIAEGQLPALSSSIGDAIASHATFDIAFSGVRAVPSARRCRMLWADFVDPTGACSLLATTIEDAAAAYGATAEDRPFKAHITLCRARRPKRISEAALEGARSVLDAIPRSMSVREVTLFSSRLTPRGPVYSKVDAWSLRGK